jgi:hypothetical protein
MKKKTATENISTEKENQTSDLGQDITFDQ